MDAVLILEKIVDDGEFADKGFTTSRGGADKEVLVEEESFVNGFFLDVPKRGDVAISEDLFNFGVIDIFIELVGFRRIQIVENRHGFIYFLLIYES